MPTPFTPSLVLLALLTLLFPTAPARGDGRKPVTVWCHLDNLPKRVRQTIDRERDNRPIKQVIEIRWDDQVAYRFLIDDRGDDRAIYVAENGRVLQQAQLPELPVGQGYYERPERLEDLPREVRRTLDQQCGPAPLKSLMFVRRNDREFYRAIIDTRGDDTAIRINTLGRLLSIDEVDDFAVGQEARRHDHCRERQVMLSDVPREVQRTIDRERRGQDVKQVVLAEVNGRRFYRVIIDQWRGDRVLRIAEDGYLYSESEVPDIAVGDGAWSKSRFGHESPMRYEDLPWAVRETLDQQRRGRQVKQIIYVRRFSHTFYRCIIDMRGDDIAIRINDEGRVVAREEVEDLALGKPEAEDLSAREEWVKYASLPTPCKRTLDKQRGTHDIHKIFKCESRGKITYKVILDTRPWPTTFRMTEDGKLLAP